MSPFIKAAAYALQDQPVVNAVIEGTDIVYRDYVDISVSYTTFSIIMHDSWVYQHGKYSFNMGL